MDEQRNAIQKLEHNVQYLIYGKIIEDNIQLKNGEFVRKILGGGGPQACFGARLWTESIGFLSRSGYDIDPSSLASLENLKIDLSGLVKYHDLPTPRSLQIYDENEYGKAGLMTPMDEFLKLLSREILLPDSYKNPKAVHLITEFADEPMVKTAFELKQKGAIFSLEPLIQYRTGENVNAMLELIHQVDIVTPDWPSACVISGQEDPVKVLEFWSELGPALVAIRHGSQGSYVWDRIHDKRWHIKPPPVNVLDPTGGGNTYGGGLCVGWGEVQDALTAGVWATVASNFMIRQFGIPVITDDLLNDAKELEKLVNSLATPL
ncbi:MAG: pfkB family carbohydrate kinase [Firmicutes bacterium ADurb.Bin419]|jgi:cytidine kinase|nr:MAG: pfkB family carbohydrate kinase [Firmicutes bacterium ADurb.Bin419]